MKQFCVMVIFIFLTGCSLFSVKSGPDNVYLINTSAHPPTHRSSALTLLVMPVTSNPVYATTQMAYSIKPYQIAYFSKNGWAQTPAQMLQPLIIQSLQNTHYFHAVTTSLAQYDYALHVELIELQQDFLCKPSVIRLKVRAQLMSATTSRIIATKQFYISKIAPCNNPYSGVVAANQATADMLYQLALFCLNAIDRSAY